jgi:hypothetical protein
LSAALEAEYAAGVVIAYEAPAASTSAARAATMRPLDTAPRRGSWEWLARSPRGNS